jgi:hypothetical protein
MILTLLVLFLKCGALRAFSLLSNCCCNAPSSTPRRACLLIPVPQLSKFSHFELTSSPDNLFSFSIVMIFPDRIDLSGVTAFRA